MLMKVILLLYAFFTLPSVRWGDMCVSDYTIRFWSYHFPYMLMVITVHDYSMHRCLTKIKIPIPPFDFFVHRFYGMNLKLVFKISWLISQNHLGKIYPQDKQNLKYFLPPFIFTSISSSWSALLCLGFSRNNKKLMANILSRN